MGIAGLLGDRIYHLYDTGKNNFVRLHEFLMVSCRFFQSSFRAKLRLVFDIFDFDMDERISGEDIRSVLSHIPLELIVFQALVE